MRIEAFSFGSITIDGRTYDHDVVVDGAGVHRRHKGASKRFRDDYGHTPLSLDEAIPWDCRRLVVGTGAAGALPVMERVRAEAGRRGVDLVTLPTADAIRLLGDRRRDTNAILHVTC